MLQKSVSGNTPAKWSRAILQMAKRKRNYTIYREETWTGADLLSLQSVHSVQRSTKVLPPPIQHNQIGCCVGPTYTSPAPANHCAHALRITFVCHRERKEALKAVKIYALQSILGQGRWETKKEPNAKNELGNTDLGCELFFSNNLDVPISQRIFPHIIPLKTTNSAAKIFHPIQKSTLTRNKKLYQIISQEVFFL